MNLLDGFYLWFGATGASVVVWTLGVLAFVLGWGLFELEVDRRKRRDRRILRQHAIRYYLHRDQAGCLLCGGTWQMDKQEAHQPFCAAE